MRRVSAEIQVVEVAEAVPDLPGKIVMTVDQGRFP
jgi:hypothetical protein